MSENRKSSRLCAVLISSAVLCSAAGTGMPVSADTEIYSDVLGGEVDYLGAQPDKELSDVSRELRGTLSAEDTAFLERCRGICRGREDIPLRSSSAARLEMYDELYEKCAELWSSNDDIELGTYGSKYILFTIDNSERGMTPAEAVETYYCFMYDNPVFYYLTPNIGSYKNGSILVYTDESVSDAALRAEYRQDIMDCCESSSELVSREKTAYDNSLALHNKICGDMSYAYDTFGAPSSSFEAHNILGCITEHEGVCESYGKTYSLLLSYNGIDNVFVAGKGNGGAHAWNAVRLDDGEFYFTDVTWDDLASDTEYFAVGADRFSEDHVPDTPSGTGAAFLYALPEVPAEDFSLADHFAELAVTMDINSDGSFNNRDLKALQKLLIGSGETPAPDVNGDGKLNNRDLKELQLLLIRYMSR